MNEQPRQRKSVAMFDPRASYQLDAVIVLLDARPPLFLRLALRWYKRLLERAV